jgi:exosortase E/protease (VPEID-CTERM system)
VTHLLSVWAAPTLRLIIGFLTLLATFSFLDRNTALAVFSQRFPKLQVSRTQLVFFLSAHLFVIAVFAWIGTSLYNSRTPGVSHDLLTVAALVSAALAVVTIALTVLSPRHWMEAAAIPGAIWGWAAGAAILVAASTSAIRSLWLPASKVTFALVRLLLRPLVALTVLDPVGLRLGTSHFRVIISPECSGLEGVSLLLLFGGLWLILFRKECRFPQAFLLLPLGVVLLFLLNSVRIAALLLIGHAGAKQIAARGFHSEAGWILFNAVAFGLCVAARRLPWFTTYHPREIARTGNSATELYLTPLLSILAAGMVAQAGSGTFQWLYPLRVAAPLLVIWFYRREYVRMDWSTSEADDSRWIGPAAGLLVFAIWVGFDRLGGAGANAAVPTPLRDSSTLLRTCWIAVRAFSAVIVVPVAEELAFRGFLIRRVLSPGFNRLPGTAFSWSGILISSAVFGALHGARWPAGVLAGIVYGLVFVRRGRLGDAIVAHATTNALLAAAVLVFGAWQFW